jgi:ketosteroid isomerase-like protein
LPGGFSVKRLLAVLCLLALVPFASAQQQEPDHEIHEALRALLKDMTGTINSGQYDKLMPFLAPDVEATSITQEVMSSREDVKKYFEEWFGPKGYMRKMTLTMEPDKLTQLTPDKRWGLVRGKALEHYEAKDGDVFDFVTRWTAVMARGDDGKWYLRAIHFGTNNLDNPVLTKVKNTLIRDGVIGAAVALLLGVAIGWFIGRRRKA